MSEHLSFNRNIKKEQEGKEKQSEQEKKQKFQIGDVVIYGTNGVCVIKDCGKLDMSCAKQDTLYYTIEPYYNNNGSTFYTPIDNDKVILRPIITKDEAMKLIQEIASIDSLWVQDEKRRELEYKEAVKKCDCREYVKIIKAIYLRMQSRMAEGKKVTSGDEKYFKIAEENLYGELAISLGMTKEETKDYVIDSVSRIANS